MKRLMATGFTLALMLAATAQAHEAAKGPNGGAVVDSGGHHIEFVPNQSELLFYLTGEDDAPIASSGSKVKAIVQEAGSTKQLELTPAEPNKLVGKTAAPLATGTKVVVTGSLADGHAVQGRFVMP